MNVYFDEGMGILKKWKRSIYKRLLAAGMIGPKVVVLMDGGICSQMHQYLLGQLYEKRGFNVVYDLSFYNEWGTDKDHIFVRNFDLLKAFPYLDLKKATSLETSAYKRLYYYVGNNTTARIKDFSFLDKKPPVYLGGYYYFPSEVFLPEFRSLFRLLPDKVLDAPNLEIFKKIGNISCSVAVHVRRGDLKVEQYDYGKPPTMDYFKKAVEYFKKNFDSPYFCFFSDEPDWVESTLVRYLKLDKTECKVIDINGSDKGYMDLFLIANCKHQIASKGTLGKYGAMLQDNPQKTVVLCDDQLEYRWKELLCNAVFL